MSITQCSAQAAVPYSAPLMHAACCVKLAAHYINCTWRLQGVGLEPTNGHQDCAGAVTHTQFLLS